MGIDSHGKVLRDNENWRKNKTLGSLLCRTTDITARCIQDNEIFHSSRKLWRRQIKIPLKTRLPFYNAYCVSFMLYNCNSRAVLKAMLNKLDASHRRHLCTITGHCWPKSLINNQALYKLCNDKPLLKCRKAEMATVSPCPTRGPWRAHSGGIRLRRYGLTSLQIPTRKALHKPAGNNTFRPQAGWTQTPPHSKATPLLTATFPRQTTLAEDQREGLIGAAGCHSNYRDCSTQSIII